MKVTSLTKEQRKVLYEFNAEVQRVYERYASRLEAMGLDEVQVQSLLALELDEI